MLAEITKRLRQSGKDAQQAAIDLAVSVIEGKQPDQTKLDKVREAAGMSYEEFARLLEALAERKALSDNEAAKSRMSERDELAKRKKAVAEELATAEADLTKLRGRIRELYEEQRHATGRLSTIESESKEAQQNRIHELGRTGENDDWRAIRWPVRNPSEVA